MNAKIENKKGELEIIDNLLRQLGYCKECIPEKYAEDGYLTDYYDGQLDTIAKIEKYLNSLI